MISIKDVSLQSKQTVLKLNRLYKIGTPFSGEREKERQLCGTRNKFTFPRTNYIFNV